MTTRLQDHPEDGERKWSGYGHASLSVLHFTKPVTPRSHISKRATCAKAIPFDHASCMRRAENSSSQISGRVSLGSLFFVINSNSRTLFNSYTDCQRSEVFFFFHTPKTEFSLSRWSGFLLKEPTQSFWGVQRRLGRVTLRGISFSWI